MHLKSFHAPINCALVPCVALTEIAAIIGAQMIDVRDGEQHAADHSTTGAKHNAPALLVDGCPLTEGSAILLRIARYFPHAGLLTMGAG